MSDKWFTIDGSDLNLGESGLPLASEIDSIDFHETDEALVAVWLLGKISISWNYCEHQMGVLVWHYFDDTSKGIAVTSSLGNKSKADLLLNLVSQFEENEQIAELTKLCAKAFNTLRQNRNILMHSHSLYREENGKLAWTRSGFSKGTSHKSIFADEGDLTKLYENICWLTSVVIEITCHQMGAKNKTPIEELIETFEQPETLQAVPE